LSTIVICRLVVYGLVRGSARFEHHAHSIEMPPNYGAVSSRTIEGQVELCGETASIGQKNAGAGGREVLHRAFNPGMSLPPDYARCGDPVPRVDPPFRA
jgi:hypothetical protein